MHQRNADQVGVPLNTMSVRQPEAVSNELNILFTTAALCALPLFLAAPVVLYRRVRGAAPESMLSQPIIGLVADGGWASIAPGLAIIPATLPEPPAPSTHWAIASGLLLLFLSWRWLGMWQRKLGEPWSNYAEAGAERQITLGSAGVAVLLVANAIEARSFALCFISVLWFPMVAVVGWFKVLRSSGNTSAA